MTTAAREAFRTCPFIASFRVARSTFAGKRYETPTEPDGSASSRPCDGRLDASTLSCFSKSRPSHCASNFNATKVVQGLP